MSLFKPRQIEVEITINAPAERVIDVILDLESYEDWNDYAKKAVLVKGETPAQVGAQFDFTLDTPLTLIEPVAVGEDETFSYKPFDGQSWEIQWGTRNTDAFPPFLGLTLDDLGNGRVRVQQVEKLTEDSCRYISKQDFSDFNDLIFGLTPTRKVRLGFAEVAFGLKEEAERREAAGDPLKFSQFISTAPAPLDC